MKNRPKAELPFIWEPMDKAPFDISGPIVLACEMTCGCAGKGAIMFLMAQRSGGIWHTETTPHTFTIREYYRLPQPAPIKDFTVN